MRSPPMEMGGGWEVSSGPGEGSGPGARPSSPEEAGGLRVNPFVPGGPDDPGSPRSAPPHQLSWPRHKESIPAAGP